MTYKERYEKIAEDFLSKMTDKQERHICEVVDNNNYIESIRLLSKEFNIPYNAFSKIYSRIRQSGKTRDKRTNRWSEVEIDNIKKMVDLGHSISEIAYSLNRHPDAMRKKIIKIYGCVPEIDIEGEEWRRVGDSNYEISDLGRFRRVGKRKLIPGSINDGYIQVQIKGVTKQIHRLVAQAFVPNPEGKELVDHIDGNRSNNYATNLRWVTAKENSNNLNRLKLLTKKAEQRRIDKEINNYLNCIFEKGISKLELIRRIIDYGEK